MRAVRLLEVGKSLVNAEVPIPEIGPSDVSIRVRAAGICHSDAHYREGISEIDNLPVTLGHEVAGCVEKVGRDVVNVAPGDRVCVHYSTLRRVRVLRARSGTVLSQRANDWETS